MSPTHEMSACVIRDDPPATLLCYNLYRSSGLHLLTLGRRIPRIVMHQHQQLGCNYATTRTISSWLNSLTFTFSAYSMMSMSQQSMVSMSNQSLMSMSKWSIVSVSTQSMVSMSKQSMMSLTKQQVVYGVQVNGIHFTVFMSKFMAMSKQLLVFMSNRLFHCTTFS